ncbi:MAG: glyoxylate/hydroxypyruvate reductase A, partial [Burkholderiaceae bacterium]|nr:glyoxylate/hydroxypyruvate reductase A [Burkholderiaceae bacterium]
MSGEAPRLALASRSYDMSALAACLRGLRPGWSIDVWPDAACAQADVLVGWNCPPGLVQAMPNLRLLHGIAAGIDNLVAGQDIGALPVCRVIDEQQVVGMGQYVMWAVLQFHRGLDLVLAQQARREWRKPPLRDAREWRVGVMGLGAMGAHCARVLAANGYGVRGWSRTPRDIEGVQGFH